MLEDKATVLLILSLRDCGKRDALVLLYLILSLVFKYD